MKKKQPAGNRRAGTLLTMLVLLLAVFVILLYMGYMGLISDHFKNQNYNDFACGYMRENQDTLSVDSSLFLVGSLKAKPFETGLGVASCGLVLPTVTNNTGNITELIVNYSKAACEYGNNNSYNQFVWVRSLPVNITDGDIDYNRIAPSGPPGINPCFLIWRINATYVPIRNISLYVEEYMSSVETQLKYGSIKKNNLTTLRIDYFLMTLIKKPNPDGKIAGYTSCKARENCVGVLEIWGMPQ